MQFPNFDGLASNDPLSLLLNQSVLVPQTAQMIIDVGDSGYWLSLASSLSVTNFDVLLDFGNTIAQPRSLSTG